ncbi:hypothetical protein NDU88_006653, partial [Pleurodeles waltl]
MAAVFSQVSLSFLVRLQCLPITDTAVPRQGNDYRLFITSRAHSALASRHATSGRCVAGPPEVV